MALVICMVLSTLLMRSLISFMDDAAMTPCLLLPSFYAWDLRNAAVNSASALSSAAFVPSESAPLSRMGASTSASCRLLRSSYSSCSYTAICSTGTSTR